MIPERIKAIFQFIDFLDTNKKAYINMLPLVDELTELDRQRNELKPQENYKDKRQYDEIQKILNEKFTILENEVNKPVLNKLRKLNIWLGEYTYVSIYNNIIGAAYELKEIYTDEDIEDIQAHKKRYIDFRTETNTGFFGLDFVFSRLDEVLKVIFDFFKDTKENEFESFEESPIQVNNLNEALEQYKQNGNTRFTLPIDFFNPIKTAATSQQQPQTNIPSGKDTLQPLIVATFCILVNKSELIKRDDFKSDAAYCKKVCKVYKLPYKERVRINFPEILIDKNIEKVKTLIFPNIPAESKTKINDYLSKKNTSSQKLYA